MSYKFEKAIKVGKLTRYEDVEFPDLLCPCCGKELKFCEDNQTAFSVYMSFNCYDCGLSFKTLKDYYIYDNFEDYYEFVKSRLEMAKK